jgi:hypothetical protein
LNTNQEGGIYGTNLDSLVVAQARAAGIAKKYELLVAEGQDQLLRAERIKNMTGFTSGTGKLCAGNIFCISNEVIRDQLREEETDKKQKIQIRNNAKR